jgi:hypothetical protein
LALSVAFHMTRLYFPMSDAQNSTQYRILERYGVHRAEYTYRQNVFLIMLRALLTVVFFFLVWRHKITSAKIIILKTDLNFKLSLWNEYWFLVLGILHGVGPIYKANSSIITIVIAWLIIRDVYKYLYTRAPMNSDETEVNLICQIRKTAVIFVFGLDRSLLTAENANEETFPRCFLNYFGTSRWKKCDFQGASKPKTISAWIRFKINCTSSSPQCECIKYSNVRL